MLLGRLNYWGPDEAAGELKKTLKNRLSIILGKNEAEPISTAVMAVLESGEAGDEKKMQVRRVVSQYLCETVIKELAEVVAADVGKDRLSRFC